MRKRLIAMALLAATTAAGATAEQLSLPDLSGVWQGRGTVQKDDKSKPIGVRCKIEGKQSTDELGFGGICRAMLIMKREIGFDLTRNGNHFTGVYTGSQAGPARLEGVMSEPDLLVLDMTFERDVNGDDQATMTIRRPDSDTFTITTVDRMESGVDVTTSAITFARE